MAVYVDNACILFKGKMRHHLTADSLEEMHDFCASVGINRCWFHNAKRHPHYDVTYDQRDRAVAAGALLVPVRELLLKAKALAGSG